MQVRVLFFGMLKDIAGRGSDSVMLPEGATLADVLSHYQQRFPQMQSLIPSIAMSINQEYAAPRVPGSSPETKSPCYRLSAEGPKQ